MHPYRIHMRIHVGSTYGSMLCSWGALLRSSLFPNIVSLEGSSRGKKESFHSHHRGSGGCRPACARPAPPPAVHRDLRVVASMEGHFAAARFRLLNTRLRRILAHRMAACLRMFYAAMYPKHGSRESCNTIIPQCSHGQNKP